jgi:glycosyltransferase involved in cell wall biosynthesis
VALDPSSHPRSDLGVAHPAHEEYVKVSALIPTYNRRSFIFRAIDSVTAQTEPVDEIIVVDDGSTDGTPEAIEDHYGSRVKVIRQENMGVSGARRRSIDEAQGEWMAFLDSDDEWLPTRNAEFLKAISSLPSRVGIVFGNTRFVTDQGDGNTVFEENGLFIASDPTVFENPLFELDWKADRTRPAVVPSSFMRKSALIEMDCFSEGLRHAEDFLATMQIASRHSFAAIPSVVTRVYRTSDLSQSSLELKWNEWDDNKRAKLLAYALAARTTRAKMWGELYADSVRGFCKWRSQRGLPIRHLAGEQFRFGVSVRSVVFFCGAMLGTRFFRAGFAAKRKLRALSLM